MRQLPSCMHTHMTSRGGREGDVNPASYKRCGAIAQLKAYVMIQAEGRGLDHLSHDANRHHDGDT